MAHRSYAQVTQGALPGGKVPTPYQRDSSIRLRPRRNAGVPLTSDAVHSAVCSYGMVYTEVTSVYTYTRGGYFEIEFRDKGSLEKFRRNYRSSQGRKVFDIWEFDPGYERVTVTRVPQRYPDGNIRTVLEKLGECKITGVGQTEVRTKPGGGKYYTGTRVYRIETRQFSEMKELPQILDLGTNEKFFVSYRGMPKRCHNCKETGHVARECPGRGEKEDREAPQALVEQAPPQGIENQSAGLRADPGEREGPAGPQENRVEGDPTQTGNQPNPTPNPAPEVCDLIDFTTSPKHDFTQPPLALTEEEYTALREGEFRWHRENHERAKEMDRRREEEREREKEEQRRRRDERAEVARERKGEKKDSKKKRKKKKKKKGSSQTGYVFNPDLATQYGDTDTDTDTDTDPQTKHERTHTNTTQDIPSTSNTNTHDPDSYEATLAQHKKDVAHYKDTHTKEMADRVKQGYDAVWRTTELMQEIADKVKEKRNETQKQTQTSKPSPPPTFTPPPLPPSTITEIENGTPNHTSETLTLKPNTNPNPDQNKDNRTETLKPGPQLEPPTVPRRRTPPPQPTQSTTTTPRTLLPLPQPPITPIQKQPPEQSQNTTLLMPPPCSPATTPTTTPHTLLPLPQLPITPIQQQPPAQSQNTTLLMPPPCSPATTPTHNAYLIAQAEVSSTPNTPAKTHTNTEHTQKTPQHTKENKHNKKSKKNSKRATKLIPITLKTDALQQAANKAGIQAPIVYTLSDTDLFPKRKLKNVKMKFTNSHSDTSESDPSHKKRTRTSPGVDSPAKKGWQRTGKPVETMRSVKNHPKIPLPHTHTQVRHRAHSIHTSRMRIPMPLCPSCNVRCPVFPFKNTHKYTCPTCKKTMFKCPPLGCPNWFPVAEKTKRVECTHCDSFIFECRCEVFHTPKKANINYMCPVCQEYEDPRLDESDQSFDTSRVFLDSSQIQKNGSTKN